LKSVNRKTLLIASACIALLAGAVQADPDTERQAMVDYFQKKFPNVELAEFANGIYAFDENAREQWIEIEDFPPYEIAIEEGEAFFDPPFANGNG